METLIADGVKTNWQEFSAIIGGTFDTGLYSLNQNLHISIPYKEGSVLINASNVSSRIFYPVSISTKAVFHFNKRLKPFVIARRLNFFDKCLRKIGLKRIKFKDDQIDNKYQLGGNRGKILRQITRNDDVCLLFKHFHDVHLSMKRNYWWDPYKTTSVYLTVSGLITELGQLFIFYDGFKTILDILDDEKN